MRGVSVSGKSGILREDISVITKIYPTQYDDPEVAIDMALDKLDIDYIDMMLLHHPGDGDLAAYKAMEQYVDSGQTAWRSGHSWVQQS